jgi:hypothetical protein
MSVALSLRKQAVEAAQRRLARAARFVELNARKPLFEKSMKIDGRTVKVGVYLPGPVLIHFEPATGVVLARSLPGRLEELDPSCLEQI